MPRSSLESAAQNTLPTPSFHVREHILFKVVVLTYTELFTAAHLSSCFARVADMPSRRRLKSSTSDQLIVPSFRRAAVGKLAFTVAGAYLFME